MLSQALRTSVAAAALTLIGLPAFAGPTALSSVANLGWIFDTLDLPGDPTNGSPFTFTLLPGKVAVFQVTDFALLGDSFDLYVNGSASVSLSSTAFAGAAHTVVGSLEAETAWQNPSFEKFAYSFAAPGDYSFVVRGDGAAGTPAGLFYRLDVSDATAPSVPEPGSLALVGLALAGLGAASRRRNG